MALSFDTLEGGGNGPVVAAGIAGGLSGVADAWRENHAEKIREMLARIAAGEKVQSANIRAGATLGAARTRGDTAVTTTGMKTKSAEDIAKGHDTTKVTTTGMQGDTARDVANIHGDTARDVADTRLTGTEYTADQGLLGRKYTADQGLLGRKYSADRGYQGRVYSADRGYQGRTYGADRSLQGAEVRAGATRYGADRRADSLYPPSIFARPGQPPNTGQTPVTLPQVNFGQNAVGGGGAPDQPLPPAGGSPLPPAGVGQTPVTPTGGPRPVPPAAGAAAPVSDAALQDAARATLTSLGKQPTPANIQTFIQKNREALTRQLQGGTSGGGGGDEL